ncbi:ABC transporter permease protein [Gottschalkia acidurici 9a]|uniref:ABC transporter permease protein n=1 Tax=Gottschalkia acidurici (strain ATCC 7906 / DSM 604 / BCRC 14475 / CIP 104303 / KCTC 5404 / NCIMB 10678 / 9a) TaxID=1128398 RepID=K0AYP5_GOTA9|nr:FtsX-like permease family protein [Gottschalkia acidurici]AFS77850.1 ABC transporter permease protein [Gottschalkia acidurici 9a]
MKVYLDFASKYLKVHKKKTRLTVISVAISVALITGIFSMLDIFLRFERIQVINDVGNYHLLIKDASEEDISIISSRIDVQNSGTWLTFEDGSIENVKCKLGAIDEKFATNMNLKVAEGRYPTNKNEIMLEKWATEVFNKNLKVNDSVKIAFSDNIEREFVISGIYNDLGNMKASGIPGVIMSTSGAKDIMVKKQSLYLIEFKNGANIIKAENDIKKLLDIPDDNIGRNERLLAIMGQSTNNTVMGLYITGSVLFFIVLIAGVMMIYNTFNISIMERVRQFGLLRCIGASKSQIKKLVRREAFIIVIKAIPIGLLIGMFLTFVCSAILKLFNKNLFSDISLFTFSTIGIVSGILIGFFTVFIASLLPAKKASRISPVNAVTGSEDIKVFKKKKLGTLTKILHAEIAMGINNAIMKKKTLFLMSCSIAISIVMFLGFQVFIDFLNISLKTTKPYTPDITLVSEEGINNDLYKKLEKIDGVKRVYGRMFDYVNATFDSNRLTESYKKDMGNITIKDDSLFIPPEKSWLISYDRNQLNWAKEDLVDGELSEDKLNKENGIIAVAMNLRNNISIQTADLKLGDKIYLQTSNGVKEMKVMGIIRSVPFSSSQLNLATFITTEKQFTELTGKSQFKTIDIQLDKKYQDQTVNKIKDATNDSITFLDSRQQNAEMDQTFFTMAVFIYGFVIVIALISILNIINTMNTSVESKVRYLGVMRAIGMSDTQLNKMVLIEATTYSFIGCISGFIIGTLLQRTLISNFLSHYHVVWKLPFIQIALILIITIAMTLVSILGPLKRIKNKRISEIIGSI